MLSVLSAALAHFSFRFARFLRDMAPSLPSSLLEAPSDRAGLTASGVFSCAINAASAAGTALALAAAAAPAPAAAAWWWNGGVVATAAADIAADIASASGEDEYPDKAAMPSAPTPVRIGEPASANDGCIPAGAASAAAFAASAAAATCRRACAVAAAAAA